MSPFSIWKDDPRIVEAERRHFEANDRHRATVFVLDGYRKRGDVAGFLKALPLYEESLAENRATLDAANAIWKEILTIAANDTGDATLTPAPR